MYRTLCILLLLAFTNIAQAQDCLAKAELTPPTEENKAPKRTVIPQPRVDMDKIIQIFMQAVAQGQLVVFEIPLTRSMLEPIQVEYIYRRGLVRPIVTVYSHLYTPLVLPEFPQMQIHGVSAVLDRYGNIIEATAHGQPVETH